MRRFVYFRWVVLLATLCAAALSAEAQQVTVSPTNVNLTVSKTQQFTATVTGLSPTSVTWSISPAGSGTISGTGLYTAPSTINSQQSVTVKATSTADTTKSGTATLTLLPISVTLSPSSANVQLEHTQQFTATVNNSTAGVTWSLNPPNIGTISSTGLYSAPNIMPSPASVTVTATTVGDPTKSVSATVSFVSVSINMSPSSANVIYGTTQQFTANVNNSSLGATWSITPTTGGGTISSSGLYTAPAAAGSVQSATVKATSVADPTKSVTATISFVPVTISISPSSASLNAGQTRQFTANVTNGNPQTSPQATWSLNPPGVGTISASGLYTAPATVATQQTVTVIATSATDTSKTASAVVTLNATPSVTVSPATTTLGPSQTQQFTAAVTGLSNSNVNWTISPGGTGSINNSGLYTAPATITTQQTVTVTATSQVDNTRKGTATITLLPPSSVSVTVSPTTASLYGGGTQQFTATVMGSSNTAVTWTITPSGTGTISASGLYTAPPTIAAQQAVTVTAASLADTSKSASATVTLLPRISVTISPGVAVLAGAQSQQFTATVANSSNTAVSWTLNPAGAGTFTSTGIYTAPANVISSTYVTIIATSQVDQSTTGLASVLLLPPPVTIALTPASATLFGGQVQQFTAAVGNSNNTAVTWLVNPPGIGTIGPTGTYTAPAGLTAPQSVGIVATSAADPTISSTATVTLDPSQLISVSPNTGRAGEVVTVSITGQNTTFVQGTTQASFGSGVTVGTILNNADGQLGQVQVTSATTATATLKLNATASLGARTVTVQVPAGQITLPNAFTVTPAAPTITIQSPVDLNFTNTSPVAVRGIVSDPTASVTINGISAQNSGGAFLASAVPLVEGNNELVAVATSPTGITGTSTVRITLDTTPPKVAITSPAAGVVTTAASLAVTGTVNDIVVGTVNNQQATVTVNGTSAAVANRTFVAPNISLALGPNTIQVVGTDRSGNSSSTSITVTRVVQTQPEIRVVSGTAQSGVVSTPLPSPLVVKLVDAGGLPQIGKPVIFNVVQANGSIDGGSATVSRFQNGGITQSVIVNTDATGQARVNWTLGSRAGAGNNRVEATASGFSGTAVFTANATSGTPSLISVDAGTLQTGAINTPLAFPFVVVVSDAGHNRLANVPVTFTVMQGGGSLGGQTSITQNTDGDGRVLAVLTLGPQAGAGNNVVQATFVGNQGAPVIFTATALSPGDPTQTQITGVVVDNANVPIPGVTMRLYQPYLAQQSNIPIQIGSAVQTDAQGQFVMTGVPVGRFKLMADGGTAQRSGTWPTLEYDMVTVAGNNNTVGTPIYLLPLDTAHQVCVTNTTGGTLTLPQVPGFSLTIQPGSVTFPGGTQSGCVSVTPVHLDKVPMVPAFGQQPRFVVTIQPVGAMFSPPAAVAFPNVDSLKPREVTEIFSFDHDLNAFVSIGTGTVSDDGQVVKSDPGIGILKAGWHMPGPPSAPGNGQNVTLSISAFVVDHDNPANNTFASLPTGSSVYGGSGDVTSDVLQLLAISNPPSDPPIAYTWSVSGPGANVYLPPGTSAAASQWTVGSVRAKPGVLTFTVVAQYADGRQVRTSRDIDVGIRSDDVIVVGWIDRRGVTLPSGVDSWLLSILPPIGPPVASSVDCNLSVARLSKNEDVLAGNPLSLADRHYFLNWLFAYADNPDPTTVIPGDFRGPDGLVSESKIATYTGAATNYKLFNRFQVKFRSNGTSFIGRPTLLKAATPLIGTTHNPCGTILGALALFPGQAGWGQGSGPIVDPANSRISLINDGSPDSDVVSAFNTLMGKDVPAAVFWEDIGSRITFFPDRPTATVVSQPYPTYYQFLNGALVNVAPEAADPTLHFYPNPYPFGTDVCTKFDPFADQLLQFNTTPGGRCGIANQPPASGVRMPPYIIP